MKIYTSMKDIAQKAETSIATVSYVINNVNRYIRPELRARVLQAADELGYVKNASASSLKGKTRGIIAVLVPQFGNTYFTHICVEIENLIQKSGYILNICNSNDNYDLECTIIKRLESQRVDGLIICPAYNRNAQSNNQNIKDYNLRVPHVILDRFLCSQDQTNYDYIGHDGLQSGYLATMKLLMAGHRRIAFAGWDSPISIIRDRLDGYKNALNEFSISYDPDLVFLSDIANESGILAGKQIISSKASAVVLGHQNIAKGVIKYFYNIGISWPEDISIVMIGTPDWNTILQKPLTCIQRPEREMGFTAATILIDKIENPNKKAIKKILPCSLVEGSSIHKIDLTAI